MNVIDIAKVCHEVNRAYCEAIGDNSQEPWEFAPNWQRESAVNGVRYHIENPESKPSDSHDSWMAEKIADGWVYGKNKDVEAKTHPCIVLFDKLPKSQKAKDYIFRQVVRSLYDYAPTR